MLLLLFTTFNFLFFTTFNDFFLFFQDCFIDYNFDFCLNNSKFLLFLLLLNYDNNNIALFIDEKDSFEKKEATMRFKRFLIINNRDYLDRLTGVDYIARH